MSTKDYPKITIEAIVNANPDKVWSYWNEKTMAIKPKSPQFLMLKAKTLLKCKKRAGRPF